MPIKPLPRDEVCIESKYHSEVAAWCLNVLQQTDLLEPETKIVITVHKADNCAAMLSITALCSKEFDFMLLHTDDWLRM